MLAVAHILGMMMAFFAVTFVMPMVCAIITQDGTFDDFAIAAGINVVIGLAIAGVTRRYKRELKPRDGFLLVTLSWVLMSASAAVPLLISLPELSFTDAYFEAVSGLTTTGATVLTGLEQLPPSINLWRHALHWFGGIGIIVLAVAVLPLLGVGGMALYRAETPGPVKDEKLTPRITETAKALWLTYAGLTLIAVIALRLAGMGWFDAICHAFSVIALGGFSTRDASIGAFDSVLIEAILGVFMLAAVINFATHFVALRARSVRVYLRNLETVATVSVILGGGLLIAVFLYGSGIFPDFASAFRHALFNTISVATSTGYMGEDYGAWPPFAAFALLFLACVASSAGSTGGGIKMVRAIILLKQAGRELKRLVHPHAVIPLSINGNSVEERVIYSVFGFMLLWGVTQVVLTFVMVLTGIDFDSALSAVVASVNNLGPALGRFGPAENFSSLNDFQAVLLALAMLAGRLELLTFFAVLTPAFWRR